MAYVNLVSDMFCKCQYCTEKLLLTILCVIEMDHFSVGAVSVYPHPLYQISSKMDIETMPHAMYFSGNKETITKINQVPYQVIDYDDKGIFQAKLMDNTQVEIFIDNGATLSILQLSVYHKYLILQKYKKNRKPLSYSYRRHDRVPFLDQTIQIKTLVCDSECPYDIVLGCTSLAKLLAWQDYASRQLLILLYSWTWS